jgi:hypothetical protein
LFFGIHTSSQVALSVEFAMLAVVAFSTSRKLEQVVGVHLLANHFVVLVRFLLIFVVYFGFDIEELVAGALAATFTGMALRTWVSSRIVMLDQGAHYVFILIILVFVLFFVLVIFFIVIVVWAASCGSGIFILVVALGR